MPNQLSRRVQQIAGRGAPAHSASAAQRRTVEDAFLHAEQSCLAGAGIGASEIARLSDSLSRLYGELETRPAGLGLEGRFATLLSEAIARRGWLSASTRQELARVREAVIRLAAEKRRKFEIA